MYYYFEFSIQFSIFDYKIIIETIITPTNKWGGQGLVGMIFFFFHILKF